MKILLYLEAEKFLRKSGIGRAIYHQKRALEIAGLTIQQILTRISILLILIHTASGASCCFFALNEWGKKSFTTVTRQKKTLEILLLGQTY